MRPPPPHGRGLAKILAAGQKPMREVRCLISPSAKQVHKSCTRWQQSIPAFGLFPDQQTVEWPDPADYHWPVKGLEVLVFVHQLTPGNISKGVMDAMQRDGAELVIMLQDGGQELGYYRR